MLYLVNNSTPSFNLVYYLVCYRWLKGEIMPKDILSVDIIDANTNLHIK